MEIDSLIDIDMECFCSNGFQFIGIFAGAFIYYLSFSVGRFCLCISKLAGLVFDIVAMVEASKENTDLLMFLIALFIVDRGGVLFLVCCFGYNPTKHYKLYAKGMKKTGLVLNEKGLLSLYYGSIFSTIDFSAQIWKSYTFVVKSKTKETENKYKEYIKKEVLLCCCSKYIDDNVENDNGDADYDKNNDSTTKVDKEENKDIIELKVKENENEKENENKDENENKKENGNEEKETEEENENENEKETEYISIGIKDETNNNNSTPLQIDTEQQQQQENGNKEVMVDVAINDNDNNNNNNKEGKITHDMDDKGNTLKQHQNENRNKEYTEKKVEKNESGFCSLTCFGLLYFSLLVTMEFLVFFISFTSFYQIELPMNTKLLLLGTLTMTNFGLLQNWLNFAIGGYRKCKYDDCCCYKACGGTIAVILIFTGISCFLSVFLITLLAFFS